MPIISQRGWISKWRWLAISAGTAAVALAARAGYETMWLDLASLFPLVGSAVCFGLAAIGLSQVGRKIVLGITRIFLRVGLGLALLLVMNLAFATGKKMARVNRTQFIENAAEAGLAADCVGLLTRYQNDARMKKDGYLRIFPEDLEFATLPKSVLMLEPVYVILEWRPRNVGICKNGFGGFSAGVRVFADEKEVMDPSDPNMGAGKSERIAPQIYYREEPT